MVEVVWRRRGTLPGYVAAEVMDITMHPGGEEDGVFVFGNASAKWETGDCMSLTDWAWDHEVDLIGWLEVIEAMDKQRDNAGEGMVVVEKGATTGMSEPIIGKLLR